MVRILVGSVLVLLIWASVNWTYHAINKPSEVLFPLDTSLTKSPSETWKQYDSLFRKHSTSVITPDLLAALAQVDPNLALYWARTFEESRNARTAGFRLIGTMFAAFAGVAGLCLALSYTLAPSQIYAWIGVVFAAVMIGGLGNPLGALVAGIVIGVSEALTMALTAPAWAPLVSFSLLIIVLLVRARDL